MGRPTPDPSQVGASMFSTATGLSDSRDSDTQNTTPISVWGLRILECPQVELIGRRIPVETQLRIGRIDAPGIDLALDDPLISRRHAAISLRIAPTFWSIDDLGSKNGTWVGGDKVRRAFLPDGAVLRLGSTVMQFGELDAREGLERPGPLVGDSPAMLQALDAIRELAPTRHNVLLMGEAGTGKTVVARVIHDLSGRRGPFESIDCARIPRSRMESAFFGRLSDHHRRISGREGGLGEATGGTLFLDRVERLPIELQEKLLRSLESGRHLPVGSTMARAHDVRLVAATDRDLNELVDRGVFHEDLVAFFAEPVVTLPPLRQRLSDVPILLRKFLDQHGVRTGVRWSYGFVEALLLHSWRGNLQELDAVAKRLAGRFDPARAFSEGDLPLEMRRSVNTGTPGPPQVPVVPPFDATTTGRGPAITVGGGPPIGKPRLRRLILQFEGDVDSLAGYLQLSPEATRRLLRRHDLHPEQFRPFGSAG